MKKLIVAIPVILMAIIGGLILPILLNGNPGNADTQQPKQEYTPSPLSTSVPTMSSGWVQDTSPSATAYEAKGNDPDTTPSPNTGTAQGTPLPTETSPTVAKGSGEWIEIKIQEHRDEILDEDLADFRRIYSKVDIAYLKNLGIAGFSNEETEKAKAYLRQTLGDDYERAKMLFYRYFYILNED
ncbi:MAG: hypothetical protein GX992_05080 [Clostridium sp.]|mgnify:CR=1 FL=1|nr:hypothetical protein [Clostridium sp.]